MIVQGDPQDQEVLKSIRKLLQQESAQMQIGEQTVSLPISLRILLAEAAHQLARGHYVALIAGQKEMTTQQVADLLSMSRPHLVKLLENGVIPFIRVGTHRRVLLEDVLVFQQRRAQERETGLAEIAAISQEMGLYD